MYFCDHHADQDIEHFQPPMTLHSRSTSHFHREQQFWILLSLVSFDPSWTSSEWMACRRQFCVSGFFQWTSFLWDTFILLCVSVLGSLHPYVVFQGMNMLPLIFQLVGTRVISNLSLLCIKLLWIFACMHFCGHTHFFISVWTAGSYMGLC